MYNLEIQKAIEQIKKEKAKTVLIQLPEGLKPKAKEIIDEIEEKTKAEVYCWISGSYGACDIPEFKADILIQWGHSEFIKEKW